MMHDLSLVAPELFLLTMACVILVFDLFLSDGKRDISYWLTQAALAGALLLSYGLPSDPAQSAFHGQYISDGMAKVLKSFIYVVVMGVFVYSRPYLRERGMFKGEYLVLGLFAVLGMVILVSAYNLLILYLGLELLSLSLYAMVAFARDSREASEAAMKYFVLGAIASGMLLYGISLLYGVTGTLELTGIARHLVDSADSGLPLVFGLAFVVVGVAFKLGAVPFHMWLPDVYHGAPTAVTLFIGTAPKLAGFAMAMRLLVGALGEMQGDWQGMLVLLSVLSLTVGNIVAIAQTNIKRMLAYSTISHVGFLILGLLAGTSEGYAAAMFYTVLYALMALGAFGMVVMLSRNGIEAEHLDDYKGLNQRSPWLAFLMLLIMFSMAGVPPTAGFYAKLAVLQSVVRVDLVWLAVYAVVMSVVGAFYYLRVVKLMYFDAPEGEIAIVRQWDTDIVVSINGLLMLALGLFPGGLMALCARVVPG